MWKRFFRKSIEKKGQGVHYIKLQLLLYTHTQSSCSKRITEGHTGLFAILSTQVNIFQ